MTSSLTWDLGLGFFFFRESNQALEEEEREGKTLVSVLLEREFEEEEGGCLPLVGRRVDLCRVSRGVWDLDCLPNDKGKLALIPSYISASSSSIFSL